MRAIVLALGAAAVGACIPTAPLNPDGGTNVTLPCYGQSCVPNMVGAPVTLPPIPASEVDCQAAEQGLEFFPGADILNNEYQDSAEFFYQYVDGTAGIWPSGYTPPAIQQNICKTDTNNHVLHESGGPFTGWGGGIGVGLAHMNNDTSPGGGICSSAPASAICPSAGGYTTSTPCYCPGPGTGALGMAVASLAMDMSQWDGISFWARRGPNGQPLMRVLVGDKFTDDDISYFMYSTDPTQTRLCERKGECTCAFQDTTCNWYSNSNPYVQPDTHLPPPLNTGGFYCGAPLSHPGAASSVGQGSSGGACNSTSTMCANNYCGRSLCNQPYPAYASAGPDPEWVNRACTPYTYRNGTQLDLCYNPTATFDNKGNPLPADPKPAEPDEQCGDHFTFPVTLSENWQFYTIPFSQMSQQGWAKQAPYFDLTSVSVVRFTWDVGYVDYYLDNVRFYRLKANGQSTTPPP